MINYFKFLLDSPEKKAEKYFYDRDFRKARKYFLRAGMENNAVNCSLLLQDWQDLATRFYSKNPQLSALYSLLGNDYDAALVYYSRLENTEAVAAVHCLKGEHRTALSLLENVERIDLIRRICSTNNLSKEWIGLELKFGYEEEAILISDRTKDWEEVAGFYESKKEFEKAGIFYRKQKNYEKAIDCFLNVDDLEIVREICKENRLWEKLASIEYQKQNFVEALVCFERLGDLENMAFCYDGLGESQKALNCRVELWQRLVLERKDENAFDNLLKHWKEQENIEKIREVCEVMNRYILLGEIEEEFGHHQRAIELFSKFDRLDKAALLYEKKLLWKDAAECWREIFEWQKAIDAFHKVKDSKSKEEAALLSEVLADSNALRNTRVYGHLVNDIVAPKELVISTYGKFLAASFLRENNFEDCEKKRYNYKGTLIFTNAKIVLAFKNGMFDPRYKLAEKFSDTAQLTEATISVPYTEIEEILYYSPNILGKFARFGKSGPAYYQKFLFCLVSGHQIEVATQMNDDKEFTGFLMVLKEMNAPMKAVDAFTILHNTR